ncbi:mitochondrial ribosomal protein subunit S9 [Piptocephalis cylindrospora]|uniref:Small ribosomal subunit protein uS9m n=1 Tax=Piptocephalis cylindrospora TaxID=1907219 RepID=A0A4P9Y688_9FUNG|nr:mitochondrial ribosomal protein subunit S9 [Piptocephalis cylindrospora]|eukprot:RKP14596.1 mitochondrial ribosomal protein subunit S9 [Piptocephalis cylindrospora]
MNTKVGKDVGLEEGGVAAAFGWRKSAKAKVWLVPAREDGKGEVRVNGLPLGSWVREETQRESVIRGLVVGDRVGRYNAWCTVSGGGMTGQVEAVRLALARALTTQEYDLKATLRKAGLISHDWRTVERKKPGQPKARKKFTW